jgi:uncharacterized protein (DUF952 family)
MICHVTDPARWLQALRTGSITAASLATEGFIHCSSPDQIVGVVNRFYATAPTLVLVLIDDAELGPELVWENAVHPDPSAPITDEQFPHLYAPIPMSAVRDSFAWRPDLHGVWHYPSHLS